MFSNEGVGIKNLEFAVDGRSVGRSHSIDFIGGRLFIMALRYLNTSRYKTHPLQLAGKIDQRCRRRSRPSVETFSSQARKGLPIITPILQLRLLCAHDISVPVESFKIAITNSVTSCTSVGKVQPHRSGCQVKYRDS